MKSNNNEKNIKKTKKKINKTINNQNIKNFNKNSNLNINKPLAFHTKNKTFDFNTIYQNEKKSKHSANNNFDNFKSLLENNNYQRNIKRKKINSKFNLIKKPISEVIHINPIMSPQVKKVNNKITNNKSISHNKEKKKKIIYGLNEMNGINNSNNYNKQKNFEINSPQNHISNKKNNNMTFNFGDNNKLENINNINIDGIIKKSKIKTKKII